jgi:hypothetical protein
MYAGEVEVGAGALLDKVGAVRHVVGVGTQQLCSKQVYKAGESVKHEILYWNAADLHPE